MEADAALVRANGIVELHAIADVVLHFALIVNPSHAEGEDTIRLDHALYDFVALEFRMLIIDISYREEHFLHGLKVLFFARMLGLQVCHNTVNIHNNVV